MQLLYELVKHPYRIILTRPCAHKQKRFTWDYDYECIACGQRFDNA